jgi:hypothetical protein
MASDVIRLICPNLRCRAILSVPGAARGRVVRCRQCGQRVHVPTGDRKPAPAPVEPTEPAETAEE